MEPVSPIRILIVDDHTILREGLTILFDREQDMHVIAQAANGQVESSRFQRCREERKVRCQHRSVRH